MWPSSTPAGMYIYIYRCIFIYLYICIHMYMCIYIISDRIGDAAGADVAIVDPPRYIFIYIERERERE